MGKERSGPSRAMVSKQQAKAVQHYDDSAAFVTNDAESKWNFAQHRASDEHRDGAERDNEILANDGPRAAAELKSGEKIFQPVVHQHHFRLLECGIRAARSH